MISLSIRSVDCWGTIQSETLYASLGQQRHHRAVQLVLPDGHDSHRFKCFWNIRCNFGRGQRAGKSVFQCVQLPCRSNKSNYRRVLLGDCQSGVWKSPTPTITVGGTTVLGASNSAEAYCPAGQQVVAGGGACQGGNLESSFWGNDGGWYARCNGGSVQVWAACMKI